MKQLLLIAMFLLLAVSANAVTKTVVFTWTAPGDDGNVGTASVYDMRISTDSLLLKNSWATCTQIVVPVPHIAGTHETFSYTADFNTGINYYIAIKAADEVLNWAPISNIKTFFIPDAIAPNTINDLNATVQ
jgi:hypothetical protein